MLGIHGDLIIYVVIICYFIFFTAFIYYLFCRLLNPNHLVCFEHSLGRSNDPGFVCPDPDYDVDAEVDIDLQDQDYFNDLSQ